MLPTSIFLLSAPNLSQEQLYLAIQQCPNWALSLFTCSLVVCAQPFRAPGGIPSTYLQSYPFVGHLLMAYKALRACLPPTLDPPSTPCHSLSEFRSYLFPLCSLHSSHSGLFPVPLCTKYALALSLCNDYYSLCLKHSFQISAWHTPLLPAISAQMSPSCESLAWKPYSRFQPPPVNNLVPLIRSIPLLYGTQQFPTLHLIHLFIMWTVYCQPSTIGIQAPWRQGFLLVLFTHVPQTPRGDLAHNWCSKMCWKLNEWWIRIRARIQNLWKAEVTGYKTQRKTNLCPTLTINHALQVFFSFCQLLHDLIALSPWK